MNWRFLIALSWVITGAYLSRPMDHSDGRTPQSIEASSPTEQMAMSAGF